MEVPAASTSVWPTTFEAALLGSHPVLPPAASDRLRALADDPDFDWQRVLLVSAHHGTSLMVLKNLRPLKDLATVRPLVNELKHALVHQKAEKQAMLSETERVTAHLREAGIEPLVLKGAPLTQLAHGDLRWRLFGDIDLLVDAADYPTVDRRLADLGFTSADGTEWAETHNKRFYLWLKCEWGYAQTDLTVQHIDLHTRFVQRKYRFPWSHDALVARSQVIDVGPSPVAIRTAGLEDTLLHLAFHGNDNGWILKYMADAAGLLHRHVPDWDQLLRLARSARCVRLLSLFLTLTQRLYATALPTDVAAVVRGQELDGMAQRILQTHAAYADQAAPGAPMVGPQPSFQSVALQDTWWTKLRYAAVVGLRGIIR